MIANYHTHTWRCMHASGEERAYVERAIEGGLKILGYSDHTPYPFPEGYVSGMRMRMDQLEEYVDTVLALKVEYRNEIEIHLGLEVEFYPAYFPALLNAVADYPVEYFLLAQHHLGNEIGDFYSGTVTQDPRHLERYVDQVREAMSTGRFTYLAHPDLIHFTGNSALYDQKMRELCRCAKAQDLPLEINFLGIGDRRHYPNEAFWKIAGEEHCKVIYGADAHTPETVWNPQAKNEADRLVEKYGLLLAETVPFRNPVSF
ncbi:MAG: histidinol-phosphatase [Fusicatenibacter sp.]|nr:histidinol-phosphatase [Fusicatenibacter sp.]